MTVYDLHFDLVDPMMQSLEGNFAIDPRRPTGISGPQKVVNRFMKTFLTTKGSDPLHRNAGTDFPSLLDGNINNPSDVEPDVITYIEDVVEQMREIDQESKWLTADEKIETAVLTQFNATGSNTFEIYITITTVSGARVGVLLPFALSTNG
jgi:hypothetical protein